jgi:hypothetical protein
MVQTEEGGLFPDVWFYKSHKTSLEAMGFPPVTDAMHQWMRGGGPQLRLACF